MKLIKIFYFIMCIFGLIGIIFSIMNLVMANRKAGIILLPIMIMLTLYWVFQLKMSK